MHISFIKRIFKAYQTIGLTFGRWISPIFVGLYLLFIRTINFIFMKMDWIFFWKSFFILGLMGFGILSLWVILKGLKDIRKLLNTLNKK